MTSEEYKIFQSRMNAVKSMGMEWDKQYGLFIYPGLDPQTSCLSIAQVIELRNLSWERVFGEAEAEILAHKKQQAAKRSTPQAIWNEIKRHVFEQIMQSGFSRKVVYESDIKAVFDALGVDTTEKAPF